MLAPGTREHWIPWRMRLHGWSQARAEAEFLLYELRMNEAHDKREMVVEYLKPIEFNPDAVPKPHPMLTRAQMLEKYPND